MNSPTANSIEKWLVARLAERLALQRTAINPGEPFSRYGLESLQAIQLTAELSGWLQRSLPDTLMWEYPSPSALARQLAGAERPSTSADRRGSRSSEISSVGRLLSSASSLQPFLNRRDSPAYPPLAIVGMACRFPGADNLDDFWTLLRGGREAVRPPDARRKRLADPGLQRGGLLDRINEFDAAFFGISRREACRMDPQQRLLLEAAWEALEDAALAADDVRGSDTGVFVGVYTSDYGRLLLNEPSRIDGYTGTGGAYSLIANRLSYFLDLRGPSLAIDTACSASLTALHTAARSLHAGDCRLAVVGGVNLLVSPEMTSYFERAGMLSPDGRCKTFDDAADGYVRGEGCGVIVLKRLADALHDGDRVQAVVAGSAVNQDGRSNGVTAPNPQAQQAVMRRAIEAAGDIAAHDIGYVEAHGTGTPIGDPIEAQSIALVIGEGRSSHAPCFMGSVKTNIGHLESAAGIAGLIKTVLSLQHGEIPPHLNFRKLNRRIAADDRVRIPTRREAWPQSRRIALVNGFSFGGTNASVLLTQAPEPCAAEDAPQHGVQVLCLSGKTPGAVARLGELYRAQLTEHPEQPWQDVCFTTGVGRSHFDFRRALLADSREELLEQLAAVAVDAASVKCSSSAPSIAFLFSGQGAQYAGMGWELAQRHPTFRHVLRECEEILEPHLPLPLLTLLSPDQDPALLHETRYTQPALFAVEYALARLWLSWGVEPQALLGHSVGEYAAACLAGVFSVEEALPLIAHRGRLMQSAPEEGAMAAVLAEPSRWEDLLAAGPQGAGPLDVAAHNSPQQAVVSGPSSAVDAFCSELQARGVGSLRLPVSHAFHSRLMEPALAEFRQYAEQICYSAPTRPVVSNLTGRFADAAQLTDPDYWCRQLREPVQFCSALQTLWEHGSRTFLEIGPGANLLGLARQTCPGADAYLASLGRRQGERATLASLAALYEQGAAIDWPAFYQHQSRRTVSLPTYPFERQEYWLSRPSSSAHAATAAETNGAPWGRAVRSPFLAGTLYESTITAAGDIGDHCVGGTVVVAAAYYLSMMLAAEDCETPPMVIEDITFPEPLVLHDHERRTMQLHVQPHADGSRLVIASQRQPSSPDQPWSKHVEGLCRTQRAAIDEGPSLVHSWQEAQARCPRSVPLAEHYQQLERCGVELGPSFRWLEELRTGDGEAAAQLRDAHPGELTASLPMHFGLLDACFQLVSAAAAPRFEQPATYLPLSVSQLRVHRLPRGQVWAWARLREQADYGQTITADIWVAAADGTTVAEVVGFSVKRADENAWLQSAADWRNWLFGLAWQSQALPSAATPASRRRWLVFSTAPAAGRALKQELDRRGEPCFLAVAGDEFTRLSPDSARIDAQSSADLKRVTAAANAAGAGGGEPLRVVVLHDSTAWGVELNAETAMHEAEESCGAALMIVQTLVEANIDVQLTLVTYGAQSPDPGQPLNVGASALWGLAQVVTQEHPELNLLSLDLDAAVEPTEGARLLLEELASTPTENQVARRGAQRWVRRLRKLDVTSTNGAACVAQHGSYLITGGLGGLGLEVAKWLVAAGATELVLIGRSSPMPAAKEVIRELRQRGAKIHVRAADVTCYHELASCVEQLKPTLTPLKGVIHAAGVLDDGLLINQTRQRFAPVLSAKIAGACHLHQLTRETPLDFFVLFSSAAAVLGSRGQGAYAAANASLDTLAHERRRQGLAALTINWGPWGDVGMAATLREHDRARLREAGLLEITPQQGLACLEWGLQADAAQLVVLRTDARRFAEFARQQHPPLSATPGANTPRRRRRSRDTAFLASLQQVRPVQQIKLMMDHVSRQLREVAHWDADHVIDEKTVLFDLGVDSLMAVELRNRLQDALGCVLPATTVFDYPRLDKLVPFLLSLLDLPDDPAPPEVDRRATALAELPEEELEKLLLRKLDTLERDANGPRHDH